MKILQVINALDSGGAQKLLLELATLTESRSEQIHILIIKKSRDEIFYKAIKKTNAHVIEGEFNSLYHPLIIPFLIKFMRSYDIVHSHLFPTQYLVAAAKKFGALKCILITTEHNTYNRRRAYKAFQLIDAFFYSIYRHIIAISNETEDALLTWIGNRNTAINTSVIENGINLSKFQTSLPYQKEAFGFKKNDQLLLMIARFEDQKDHITLFKALKELPFEYKLLLVGEGIKEQEYKNYCEAHNLMSRVSFLGPRIDVPSIIKSVDICVLSSNWEGFGLVAVEYMAAGKPVIASDVPGLSQIVENVGLLFPLGDCEALVQKIMYLSDEVIYSDVAKACQKRSEQFSLNKMHKSYYDLYLSLLNERNEG